MPKLTDLLVPAPLRKTPKPGETGVPKTPAPQDLKTDPPERPGEFGRLGDQALEAPVEAVAWVDQRLAASGFLAGMLFRKVPKGTNWFYTLGSAALFAFIVQAVTGVFLAMFYVPSTTQAYTSIAHINNDVFLGQFVHGMHKWGASVMVILVFLHMGRTFFFGAYKYPRELNWVIGVVILILTMTMAFTGYLLPFDQRSYWASIVGININGTGPIVGPYLSDFLRAGPELGATTLSRFYAIHMLLVPGALIALIGAHMYLVVKLGTTAPPWTKIGNKPRVAEPIIDLDAGVASTNGYHPNGSGATIAGVRVDGHGNGHNGGGERPMKPSDKQAYLEEYELLKKKGKPFFPYAVLKDSAMALVVVAVIIVMSLLLGAEQGPKADPTTTTYVPRPEWYFFFLFEVLRVIKPPELVPVATIGIPTICMVLLLLLPFYDKGPERRPERRPLATTAGILTILAMGYLTYAGATSGSPTEIDMKVAPQYKAGSEIVAGSGCLACHKLGENGNNGPGPELTHIGARIPRAAIVRSIEIGPSIMPSFRELPKEKLNELADFLSSLN